jgi:hypothetical protein
MLITLMAVACVDPGPLEPGDTNDPIDPIDPGQTTNGGVDPGGTTSDPTTDETETPPDQVPDWDGSAPEGPPGMELHAVFSCSLFVDPVEVTFVRTDDDWLWEIVPENGGGVHVPGLQPCYPADGGEMPVLLWDEAPLMTIISEGMIHTLEQTMRPDFWAGTVLPIDESSEQCDEALAALGLAWPVPLTMTMLGP